MKNFMLTTSERAELKDRLERAIVCNINERDVRRAVEIAIEGMYCEKAQCYLNDATGEADDLILNSHVNGESSMDEISEICDQIVSFVGRTNDPDYWVSDDAQ